ncbi:GGDEF domain-containing protein [Jiella pelagia]|uniref:diguanylate cyclase n=1 Tax=Jiella pelagia TaxID=2986949 RepID=A0ABY7BTL3_9HYPH|nr:GGDEF domain-containing protein [Jiella pelagia]WAP67012.1 GGDEF domain-containing protein [Jiella pelagia]
MLFWWLCPLASGFDNRVAVTSVLTSGISIMTAIAALSGDASRLGRALALLMMLRAGFFAIRAAWASAIFGPISEAQRAFGFEIVIIEGLWTSVIAGYLLLALLREKRERSLVRLAETDYLTGADNRRSFQMKAQAAWSRVSDRRETTLLMLDLDNFKQINDAFGHAFGDEVLRAFAALVRASIAPGDTFARLGGEEFVIMVPDRDEAAGAQFAETLRARFAEVMLAHRAENASITVSIGIASTRYAENLDRLLAVADEALYRAKANGRNRVECGPRRQTDAASMDGSIAALNLHA